MDGHSIPRMEWPHWIGQDHCLQDTRGADDGETGAQGLSSTHKLGTASQRHKRKENWIYTRYHPTEENGKVQRKEDDWAGERRLCHVGPGRFQTQNCMHTGS